MLLYVESAPRGDRRAGNRARRTRGQHRHAGRERGRGDSRGGGAGFAEVVGVRKANQRLGIYVPVVVSEIDGQALIRHQHRGEAVRAVVLQVVHGRHVVAVFMNLDRAIHIRPRPRLVIGMDLIGLHLPGIDSRKAWSL